MFDSNFLRLTLRMEDLEGQKNRKVICKESKMKILVLGREGKECRIGKMRSRKLFFVHTFVWGHNITLVLRYWFRSLSINVDSDEDFDSV